MVNVPVKKKSQQSRAPRALAAGTKLPAAGKLQVLTAPNLAGIPWLVHGFSTRVGGFSKAYGGALNLGYTADDTRESVERNRERFKTALGARDWPMAWLRQVHSDLIWPVPASGGADGGRDESSAQVRRKTAKPRPGAGIRGISDNRAAIGVDGGSGDADDDERAVLRPPVFYGDGLVTDHPGLLLAMRTADCLPLLLVDRKRRAVAALHAGWRGTLRRVAEKGVGEMRRWFGSRPEDLEAAIGPGIHACCYEVGEDVREQFCSQFAYGEELFTEVKDTDPIHERYPLLFLVARAPGHIEPFLPVKIRLDLVEANRRQLLAAGMRARRISASELCTACRTDLLFSHRAEKGATGRMMAVVGIRAE